VRQVVLDTETTGLNPKLGDRIIEIGCVELLNRRLSEHSFHTYLNPEREVELGATRVHGLTREDLMAKPKFAEVAAAFLDYVRGAELIIHNADFDVEFLNMELALAGFAPLEQHVARITDTLASAKELHPARRTRSTRCASATSSTTPSARCTARSPTPTCSPSAISR